MLECSAVLNRLGIESRLQFVITLCVVGLIIVTTMGGSGGAPWAFLTYRTLLALIAILSAIGCRNADVQIERSFLLGVCLFFAVTLAGVLRIQGSHFDGLYLWSKYVLFACAVLGLASYARYQSARCRGFLLGSIVVVNLAHLVPDLLFRHGQ